MKNKTLLITGAAGFIGSELLRRAVDDGFKVVAVDCLTYAADLARLRPTKGRFVFCRADIRDAATLKRIFRVHRPSAVAHLAAETHVDRSILCGDDFIQTNFAGTHAMLEAARQWGVERFFHISTDEVYGEIRKGSFKEDYPLSPNSPYSASKAAADLLVFSHQRTYGLPVVIVRPSNNYGPWQFPEKFVPVIIYKALSGQKIPVYARGLNVREWLYVADTALAILRILGRGRAGEVYNVGSGIECTNIEIVRRILKLLGKSESLIEYVADRPGHDFRYSLDSSKARRQLGWRAGTSLETGLEQTVRWYRDNIDWVSAKAARLGSYWKKVYRKA